MKKTTNISSNIFKATLLVLALFGAYTASAQCVVVSDNGYDVNLTVTADQVITTSTNCASGYNFDYKLNYNISFSGNNVPKNLYVLQGKVITPGMSDNFFDLPNGGGIGSVVSNGNTHTNRTDCGTVTIASLNPTVQIQINGPGISNRTFTCAVVALPVELVSFTVNTSVEGILLNWSTASEKNNDFFTIETSSDAVHWTTAGEVKGAGNSSSLLDYSYIHNQPVAGVNYYRLKQTDFNNRAVYSSILSIDYAPSMIETAVYPNPTAGYNVTLRIATTSSEPVEAEIYNAMGQKEKSYTIDANNGLISQSIELPTSGTMFFITILQHNTVIGKHQVLVR